MTVRSGQRPAPDAGEGPRATRRVGGRMDDRERAGAWETLRRGLALSPELRDGLVATLLLAGVATAGKVVVPVTIQQVIDVGLLGPAGPRVAFVAAAAGASVAVLAGTSLAHYAMTARLVRATEHALSNLRVRAFRHVHDLSVLHQAAEQRGSLVSRVTSDIDQISRFMQWGGVVMVVSVGQLLVASVAMLVYSVPLTLVVIACFAPLVLVLRWFQSRLSRAYDLVRRRVGSMLSAISESVVGAPVVRAYGVADRTNARIARAVEDEFDATFRAGRLAAGMFSTGESVAGTATAAVIVIGVPLGLAGGLAPAGEPWVGRLVAFGFLVTLFVSPVQVATEVLDQAQTAISGWRRVLAVLDTPPDVADPAEGNPQSPGTNRGEPGNILAVPRGPITVTFDHVSFRYPTGPPVLRDVHLTIAGQSRVAVVGETGSGKTTFVKLLTRLMDPSAGEVRINDVPLPRVAFASLRERLVMVPQDGFLFDMSIADNVRYGKPAATDDEVELAFGELGLAHWLDLVGGAGTRVGERGEALSVGERQLVALARAYVADPDLLVLDEATSAVDPATDVRLQRALEGLTRGRTALTIAHRLSTAEAADEVLVFDAGVVAQRGTHAELVGVDGVYARLHASWTAGATTAGGVAPPTDGGRT